MKHPARSILTGHRRVTVVTGALLWSLLSAGSWATDSGENARRPTPPPRVNTQSIPELVCTGDRTVTITHTTLATSEVAAPLRLRLRGNLLYLGADSTDEKFFGLINRSDRRRWISGTSTLMLDEALGSGTWARLDLGSTKISPLRCEPVVRKSP
ncbi:MAG: hypothetical protein ACO3HV_10870 [Candidatus Nanopelagicales bacterium]